MKRALFRCAALLLAFLIAAPGRVAGQASGYRDALQAGDEAFAALDNERAVAQYEAAMLDANPPAPFEVLTRLSRAYTDRSLDLIAGGDRRGGEAAIDRALATAEELRVRFPDRAETWFLLAIALGNRATFEGGKGKVRIGRAVEEHCLRAIELDPGYAPPYIVLGVFYREVAEVSWIQRLVANTLFGGLPAGSYERSAELLRQAVALDPSIPLGRFELGRTLFRSGLAAEARPHLEAGATLPPVSSLDLRNANEARRLLGLIE